MVRTKVWVCVGAEVPDAVTVTLYVLRDCELFEDVPQPASVSTKTKSNSHAPCAICRTAQARTAEAARPGQDQS